MQRVFPATCHVSRPASILRVLLAPEDADKFGIDQGRCNPSFCTERGEQGGVGMLQGRLGEVAPVL